MLEVKNLCKTYKPKKGVPVKAIDDISLKFPEQGMVFLLGKSGSGKSTLLNLLGGLDKYDGGEITIKGVSSKDFSQQYFDSYRNTYVGFIFQEYNVLKEFTVGANIALAIELQGKKATDEQINNILKQVDLEGYGNRKPNELSGGQLQRVAIARALVKNPEIIMADEPTGALDSNTGKQIFETLKKLSENKLVIVVSHDREFAEKYADRIIELSDGKVISDVVADNEISETDEIEKGKPVYNGNTVALPNGYKLTEEDRIAINNYIESLNGGELNINIASKHNSSKRFVETDNQKIVILNKSGFRLIKSKLPLRNAFKIGASGLKYKKIRLIITILLSCISFGLFGLADTFGSYNHIKTSANSIIDSKINYASVIKSKRQGAKSYWQDYGFSLSDEELSSIYKETGVKLNGVYTNPYLSLDFSDNINPQISLTETEYEIFHKWFNGFAEINQKTISDFDYKIIKGQLPDGDKNEIAISEYTFEVFKKAGYTDTSITTNSQTKVYETIKNYSDIIGKKIKLAGDYYTVTAVIDTGFNLSRYEKLVEKKEESSRAERLLNYALFEEFEYAVDFNLSGAVMLGEGGIKTIMAKTPQVFNINNFYVYFNNDNFYVDPEYALRLSDIDNKKITWLDGEKTSLTANEVIIPLSLISDQFEEEINYAEYLKNHNNLSMTVFGAGSSEIKPEEGYKIVGFIEVDESNNYLENTIIVSNNLFKRLVDNNGKGKYTYAVAPMPKSNEQIKQFLSFCYNMEDNLRYPVQNAAMYELDTVNDFLKEASKIFLYIGIGFALFAALMLSNFIGTSISYKKQDIGILRAIGSRSNDVFRIFFAESFIIAAINFVLSVVGVGVATAIINYIIRTRLGILVTVLSFSLRQIVLLAAVSLFVAFIASFLPVKKIASKKPIDAIRSR